MYFTRETRLYACVFSLKEQQHYKVRSSRATTTTTTLELQSATMTSKLLGPRANAFVARWGVRKSLGLKTSMDLMKANRAALVIQRKWRISVSNPEFVACRKRLLFEYNTLSNK